MVVSALPDLAGALNARLRSLSAVTALTSTRISTTRQPAWNLPSYAVLIETGKGKGPGAEVPGLETERIELRCYGPDERTAHLLWRTVHYSFCPPIGSGRNSGFRAADASVSKVAHEGGPLRLFEDQETWPYTWASYIVTYASEPIA